MKAIVSASALLLAAFCAAQVGTTIYGLKSTAQGSTPSVAPTRLLAFDGTLGGVLDIGAVTYGGNQVNADGLAWANGTLIGFLLDTGGSRMVSIDATTAVATNLAYFAGTTMRGATYRNGDVYALDVLAGTRWNLARIDVGTLALTSVALDTTISDGCDLDFAQNGDLWVSESNAFHKLNPSTGALSFMFADLVPEGTGNVVFNPGLVFDETSPLRAVTLEVNTREDIYVYDLSSGARTTLVNDILPNYNAGRSDLAAVPEPASLGALAIGLAFLARKRRR